ncbi:hypothetical protein AXF42_Ash010327 [Apostasia shenzhenica]|uniref:Uncharacterized protein n=1 Tax=Apostasia shenzhenica TaxID=1088818 RepID=A0A2I0BDR1_9ASPA|nr:hypothetical protein AXF42_Ash010327 [Apostasia shenzhenica]
MTAATQGTGLAATSSLCDLIAGRLLPFLGTNPARPTKETEKDLLLSLTQVRREIRLRTSELSSKNEEHMVDNSLINHCCHPSLQQTFKGEQKCLFNIISITVAFLSSDSLLVRHAAENILLSISYLLTEHESLWVKYLHLVWFAIKVAMLKICSYSVLLEPADVLADETKSLHMPHFGDIAEDVSRFAALLDTRLLNVNWFMVAHLFQALRNILKSLKRDSDGLEEVFLRWAVSYLIKLPWDLMFEIFGNGCCTRQKRFEGVQSHIRSSFMGIKNVLLGTILQLCCSVAEVTDPDTVGTSPLEEFPNYSKFANLLPKLQLCCFVNDFEKSRNPASGYLRKKLLTLMTRLSFHSHWKNSYSESWLKLLKQYFGDILYQPLSRCDAASMNCLEGSPFFESTCGDNLCRRHHWRQAIFLFLKCSFALPSLEACSNGACINHTASLSFDPKVCSLLEVSYWLQRCCPPAKFIDSKIYSESCSNFAISFLQLYLEEDDMLFKILLQLLDATSLIWQILQGKQYKLWVY